jgi:hypothetical protein
MDVDDCSFFLVFSGHAYSTIDRNRATIRFPGWIAMAAAMSFPGTHLAPSSAARGASPEKPLEAVPR